jgi:hypothetical protein
LSSRNVPRRGAGALTTQQLWHEETGRTLSLGCGGCAYLKECGGLRVAAQIYDCESFCNCTDVARCDKVCAFRPRGFVSRYLEVGGFDLQRIPTVAAVAAQALPSYAPVVFHRSARLRSPVAPAVALSMYDLYDFRRDGLRFADRAELDARLKIAPGTTLVLSGTGRDRLLENWWGSASRLETLRQLSQWSIGLVTSPNFSLFNDVPRTDNLYYMKRIAHAWAEIQSAGLLCALHLNGRTPHDWHRWAQFVKGHEELQWVAFEFATGCGMANRSSTYVAHLVQFSREVGRPLKLAIRGGLNKLTELRSAFDQVMVIDTNAFMKAQKRLEAYVIDGRLRWRKSYTAPDIGVDDLIDANIDAMMSFTVPPQAR